MMTANDAGQSVVGRRDGRICVEEVPKWLLVHHSKKPLEDRIAYARNPQPTGR
jgi:hypothetical protein